MHPSLEYALVCCLAAVGSLLLTPIARVIAIRWGAVARPRDRDVHAVATPRLGGIALFGGFAVAVLMAHQLPTLRATFLRRTQCRLGPGRRSHDLRDRGTGRQVRTRFADEACRPSRGHGRHGHPWGSSASCDLCSLGRHRNIGARPGCRHSRHDSDHSAHHQRDQLHRWARRAGRRRHRDRIARVLRIRLSPRGYWRGRRVGGPGAAERGPGRHLPRLLAAQLRPGPYLHGGFRFDARRSYSFGRGNDRHDERGSPDVRPAARVDSARPAPAHPGCRAGDTACRLAALHRAASRPGTVAVRAGQAASAPPNAANGSHAYPGGAPAVLLVGPAGLRRRRAVDHEHALGRGDLPGGIRCSRNRAVRAAGFALSSPIGATGGGPRHRVGAGRSSR